MFVGSEKRTERNDRTLFVKHVIRKVFLEDWLLKLVALAITLALWLGVTVFTKQGSARLTVPLNIRLSDNSILTKPGAKDVTIRVSGDDQKIRELLTSTANIYILLDLSALDPGEKLVTITPESISYNLPPGVRLEDIEPRGISVTLEAAEQKDVLVDPQIIGSPAKGFEIYSESASPQRVKVRGPASYIRALEELPTERIDVTGKDADFAKQVSVFLSNEYTTILDFSVVDVRFHIGEKREAKSFVVPVSGSSGKKATVVLYGPPNLFEGIKPESMKVDIERNNDGVDAPNLILPDSLKGSVEIRSVKVRQ
jgi:YbbR domain-containing protein